ncbi:hypothetical protein [Domibacillus tundrae]|uniref:hypothetical protein n=1 Tax=Domibacillus tundrae TaxID=1587527 RepID=UPI000617D7F8|nr:hypothetical protein [Domibacillus tundrae]
MWKKKEIDIMFCPRCQEDIQETDHVGITQINSVVHLYCGAWPRLGERIINEGTFEKLAKKYL